MAEGVRNDEEFSGTRPVEERHRIDEIALDGWMRANVEGYQGPLTVQQFKGGQSNPTYRLDTPGRSYVMRRRPFGKLLPSAHAVDREFKVIAALSKQGFAVAKAYALCTDDSVIGAFFYIMSMEEGRVFWDPSLPSQTPDARRKIFTSKIETLAKLHTYDPEAIGLGDFGKPGNYFARQVDRWTKQYRASETQHIPEFEKLAEWLPKTVPEQKRVSIVHGDYRLDNMIFHATEPRVQAVLDWELSTTGRPHGGLHLSADAVDHAWPRQFRSQGVEHSEHGRGGADLLQRHRKRRSRPQLVFLLQSVPARRHHAGDRRPRSRRHRRQRQGDGVGQAHRAAVESLLGVRAKGRRNLTS